MNEWEKYPKLDHLTGSARDVMETRRRHRQVRYMLYSLQTAEEKGVPLQTVSPLPGFVEFWLQEKPKYQISPLGKRIKVPDNRDVQVFALGGYKQFAKRWDVDEELMVYLRHSSVWQEWNATLMRVVPILGE